VFGWICFLPFNVSPRLWVSWHVRAHHAHANHDGRDPDQYPTLERYHASRLARFTTDAFSLGGGRVRGVLSLLLGFTVKHFETLSTATTSGLLSSRQRWLAILETALGIAGWIVVGVIVTWVVSVVFPIIIVT
jgi:fatty acid desaturase